MISSNTIFAKPCIRLRVIRQALDIKQITFADFLGVCPQTLRTWEHGDVDFPPAYRERLRFVGINAQWIDYGTGVPFEYDLPVVREKVLFSVNHK